MLCRDIQEAKTDGRRVPFPSAAAADDTRPGTAGADAGSPFKRHNLPDLLRRFRQRR